MWRSFSVLGMIGQKSSPESCFSLFYSCSVTEYRNRKQGVFFFFFNFLSPPPILSLSRNVEDVDLIEILGDLQWYFRVQYIGGKSRSHFVQASFGKVWEMGEQIESDEFAVLWEWRAAGSCKGTGRAIWMKIWGQQNSGASLSLWRKAKNWQFLKEY